jgi:hypothetical protein
MNNMNPLYQETIALQKQQEIETELSRTFWQTAAGQRPRWLDHRLAHLAEWMIATGESLRRRYDHASMHQVKPTIGIIIYGGGASERAPGVLFE